MLSKRNILETDDIAEYMWLTPEETGLGVDVFVDDGGAYKRHKHPLVMLMKNNYNQRDFEMIPVYITEYPHIDIGDVQNNRIVSYTDINGVYQFILKNLDALTRLSDRKIRQTDFFEEISPVDSIENRTPDLVIDSDKLMEYLWLRPHLTGLNVDIFVDDGGSYMRDGHEMLLLARNGYDDLVSDFIAFSMGNIPKILNGEHNNNIEYNDIFQICNFIRLNLNALQDFATDRISHFELVKKMRKSSI